HPAGCARSTLKRLPLVLRVVEQAKALECERTVERGGLEAVLQPQARFSGVQRNEQVGRARSNEARRREIAPVCGRVRFEICGVAQLFHGTVGVAAIESCQSESR